MRFFVLTLIFLMPIVMLTERQIMTTYTITVEQSPIVTIDTQIYNEYLAVQDKYFELMHKRIRMGMTTKDNEAYLALSAIYGKEKALAMMGY